VRQGLQVIARRQLELAPSLLAALVLLTAVRVAFAALAA